MFTLRFREAGVLGMANRNEARSKVFSVIDGALRLDPAAPADLPLLKRVPMQDAVTHESVSLTVVTPVFNERHVVEASLRRVLELRHPIIRSLQLIIVDDQSTDGSFEVLQRIAAEDPRVILLRNPRNMGKGAALRAGFERAEGEVTIVHDADLEYNPADIPALLVPFVNEGADAVFGSRYLTSEYRRALMYRHSLVNKALSTLASFSTDLNVTDVETCYKAVRTSLLQSMPLRSNDFRFEIEITHKLAKRRARVFEVPIRYLPRSYEEGKKMRFKDGIHALTAMARYHFIDDIYRDDAYGSNILTEVERARRFNLWMGDVLRPFVGDRVLEIGAGIGTLTNQFIPRDLYVASDINPDYLSYLRSYSFGKPYLRVLELDATKPTDFNGLEGEFDTVLLVNVLEHLDDDAQALRNAYRALAPGGHLIVLVPQGEHRMGTLDIALEHKRRYSTQTLTAVFERAGFRVERTFDFNRFTVPGWLVNGKLLRRKSFSRVQLKAVNALVPALRNLDEALPWAGLSLIGVGVKP